MDEDQPVKFEDLPAGLREVAELLAAGLTNKQIAARRVVASQTVSNQVMRLREITGLSHRVQLARWVWDAKNDGGGNGKSGGNTEIAGDHNDLPKIGDPGAGGSDV